MQIKKWALWIVPALIVIALAACITVWRLNVFILQIQLAGDKEVTLEYGSEFTPPDASASFFGSLLLKDGMEVAVTREGSVDTAKVGEYVLTYSAEHWGYTRRVSFTVHVVDTQPPEITLVADPETFTIPGQTYEEEGFSAADDYDGDLTDRVVRKATDTEIIYTVADNAGNKTEIRRTIVYKDPDPPVLELKGEKEITLYLGQKYEEPGYEATDAVDGLLTDKVTVTGEVNGDKEGTYTLNYSVSDAYGNTATASREIKVIYVPPVYPEDVTGTPVGGVIYLTFDDGPSAYTRKLLDVLAKYNVKATFFVVNTGYIDVIADIVAQGHSIGIHSITHNFNQIYASEEAYLNDLYGMQEIIRQKTGVTTTLMRFPGGSSNLASSFNPGIMRRVVPLVQEKGFQYFDWNVSSGDGGGVWTEDAVYWNVINGVSTKSVSVVLQHDSKSFSVDAVERILIWGLNNGYTFLPLTPDSPGAHHRINN